MEHTDLMTYNELGIPVEPEKEHSFAAVLTLIVGLLSILAAGGVLTGDAAELLPAISAAATPGLLAAVLAYLLAVNDECSDSGIEEVAALG